MSPPVVDASVGDPAPVGEPDPPRPPPPVVKPPVVKPPVVKPPVVKLPPVVEPDQPLAEVAQGYNELTQATELGLTEGIKAAGKRLQASGVPAQERATTLTQMLREGVSAVLDQQQIMAEAAQTMELGAIQ